MFVAPFCRQYVMVDHNRRAVERREVHYSGHVQGVGFRFAVRQMAARYAVSGFVRNLPDGRVELVAEGEPGELSRFLEEVAERMSHCIRKQHVDGRQANGEFSEFEIR